MSTGTELATVALAPAPMLTAKQKALVLSHYLHHRAPQVVYARVWEPGTAPVSLGVFVRMYADVVAEHLELLRPGGAASSTPENARSLAELEKTRDVLAQQINSATVPSAKELATLAHAQAAVCRALLAIRAQELSDAAALHALLMSNAGADDGR